jgi:hypothetical protein
MLAVIVVVAVAVAVVVAEAVKATRILPLSRARLTLESEILNKL